MKVLLFGNTGKMGTALHRVLAGNHSVVGLHSTDLDVTDVEAVRAAVTREAPDLIVNAVAFMGIDANERAPDRAFCINALFPRLLARLAAEGDATLVHFSSETVFSGARGRPLTEDDEPDPINVYGHSKFMSELAVRDACPRHYLVRLPVLFGPGGRGGQLVERMIDRARAGETPLRLADDIVTSPTYSLDAASEVTRLLNEAAPFGLYHVSNRGQASLYQLMRAVLARLSPETAIEPASLADFPSLGRKNTVTPLATARGPGLRSWEEAVAAYCDA